VINRTHSTCRKMPVFSCIVGIRVKGICILQNTVFGNIVLNCSIYNSRQNFYLD
jgi:hypothetical protein